MRSGCKPPPNNRSTTTAKRNNIKNYKQKEKRTFAPEYVTQISDDKPCKSLSSKTDRPTNRPPPMGIPDKIHYEHQGIGYDFRY